MNRQRILFVDDEPNLIAGLRRTLRKEREQWDMDFASSGHEALAKCKAQPFDVVVTDLLMPGMSGSDLLERILAEYPKTVRIVLSGHGSMGSTTRAMQVAHQFLFKPADAETLKEAIGRACSMQELIGNERIREVVASCETLPTLPSLYTELMAAAESEQADARTIGRIIARDPAISAKMLQLSNSSFFGFSQRISSIEQAAALFGITRIKALVLTEQIAKQLAPPKDFGILTSGGFWAHSLLVGEIARAISRIEKQEGDRPDQAFTAGVLHDIGKLILASQHPESFKTCFERAQKEQKPACEIEMEILGATHAEIGGYLLGLWGLPPRIVEAIALHHTANKVAYDGLCALTAVHVANALASSFSGGGRHGEGNPWASEIDREYIERIGLINRLPIWEAEARRLWARSADRAE